MRKIALICGVNSLGDTVVNIPALYALKTLYPNDSIYFILMKKFKALFENFAFIDKLVFIDDIADEGGGDFKFRKA